MAKFSSECMVRKAAADTTSVVILRPPTVYGPGERVMAYGPRSFVDAVIRRVPIVLWGDGTEQREFVFIDDLVEVVRRMMSSDCEGVFNVVSGVSYTFLDVLDTVTALAQFSPDVTSRVRTKHKVDHRFVNQLLIEQLPGIQFTDLKEGLRRTYEAEQQLH
jgi:UDP-glucose 4-epimerase